MGDRGRPHRRLLPVRRSDRRRHRRRPGRGRSKGDARHRRAAVQAQARAHPGPPRDQPGPRGLQPADEPRRDAHRPGRADLLPRHLRPRHPADRRARQLPRARLGDARRLPDPGQQQPVGDHEAIDRGDGHPGRHRGGGRDLRDERGGHGDQRRRRATGFWAITAVVVAVAGGRGRRVAADRLDLGRLVRQIAGTCLDGNGTGELLTDTRGWTGRRRTGVRRRRSGCDPGSVERGRSASGGSGPGGCPAHGCRCRSGKRRRCSLPPTRVSLRSRFAFEDARERGQGPCRVARPRQQRRRPRRGPRRASRAGR